MTHNTFVTAFRSKNGSTLLSTLLNSHPRYRGYRIKGQSGIGHVLDHGDALLDDGAHWPTVTPPEFLHSLRTWYHNYVNPQHVLHSACKFNNFRNYRWLRHVFPKDPILVVVRHPLDNYISWKHWRIKHQDPQPSHSDTVHKYWDKYIPMAHASVSQITLCHIVYFEDLVLKPQHTMQEVFAWLGFEPHEVDLSETTAIYQHYTSFPQLLSSDSGLIPAVVNRRHLPGVISADELHTLQHLVRTSGLLQSIYARYSSDFATP